MLRGPNLLLYILLRGLVNASPAATYYVSQQSPNATDDNMGTEAAPLKSIGAAIRRVQPGDTVLVGDGVYREAVVWEGEDWNNPRQRITLAAAPDAHPVIEGADVVRGPWKRANLTLKRVSETPPAIYACPWDRRAQMLFVDGEPLNQIGLQGNPKRAESTNGFQFQKQWDGKDIEDMRPGSFYYDDTAKQLYVWLADGSSPQGHTIEAAVREVGIMARGTWTIRGLEVRHVADGFWPHEQAVAVSGKQVIVENCHIHHNDFLGLIVSGQDGIIRHNQLDHNGLCGMVSNYGHRMLVEGNEFHHNAWRGDVKCLSAGNKWVQWREARFLRNYFHDEPAAALWCDINVQNALIAENLFENCSVGVYFEISRWGVIANNIVRNCGRGIWVYSSDVLVAHNIVDGCGEGITVTGHPREATYAQSVKEQPPKNCLMAVRNVLIVDNILVDCPGSFIGITKSTPFSWGNWSDYNAFVWTLPVYHRTGQHINFMDSWDTL
ncbi:MAG: right-handed parallel beta-helix repeat-containing protein [Candidatus Zipacnadales bacterium]